MTTDKDKKTPSESEKPLFDGTLRRMLMPQGEKKKKKKKKRPEKDDK